MVDGTRNALAEQMVSAVLESDASAVARLLRAGASPNSSIGPQFDDKAFCLAMDSNRGVILDMLIDAGADLNDMDPHGGAGANDPLTCAVFFYNVNAFERLLALGADPDQDLCPWCPEPHENSLLEETLTSLRFDLAWRVMQITSVSQAELKTIIIALEQFAIPDDDPGVGPREKIIEWVRERGIDVEPIELFELKRR